MRFSIARCSVALPALALRWHPIRGSVKEPQNQPLEWPFSIELTGGRYSDRLPAIVDSRGILAKHRGHPPQVLGRDSLLPPMGSSVTSFEWWTEFPYLGAADLGRDMLAASNRKKFLR